MNFSVNFQLRLLVVFYLDKDFFCKNREFVQVEFFNSLLLQKLFRVLEDYYDKYKGLPTLTVAEEEIRKDTSFIHLPEEEPLQQEFAELILKGLSELKYIQDEFIKFAKERTLKKVLSDKSEAIDGGNFDDLFAELKSESKKFNYATGGLVADCVFSLQNLREVYDEKGGMKTGLPVIDTVVGGLQKKQLSIILADTNVGKSFLLTHIGGAALRQYRKVLHVTLEMSLARTFLRYFANPADPEDGITYNSILAFDRSDQESIYQYIMRLEQKYEGYLNLVGFPTGKCTLQDLENLLEKAPATELLIVDYLELLKAPQKRDALRYEMSDITVALRGIASEYGIHVATATRANRQSVNKRIIGKEVTAEDYGKMRIADVGIGMGQNKDDAGKNEVVLNLTRSRNSEKNVAERYFMDFQHMRMKFLIQEVVTAH